MDDYQSHGAPKIEERVKIAICGGGSVSGVGKSATTHRFTMSTFYGTDPTIAENYATRVVQIGEHYAEVTILDVGASEGTWQAAFTDTMKQADAILLVYSIVNAPSLLYLDELIQLRDSIYLDRTKTPVCAVMGNKLDLADQRREIPSQHGLSWATSHGMAFTEASALKGTAIDEAIIKLTTAAIEKRHAAPPSACIIC